MSKIRIILISIAALIVLSCYEFLNPVDPDAENYQGFQTVGTVNEVTPINTNSIILIDYEIIVTGCTEATAYRIQIFESETDLSISIYETTSKGNIIDISDATLIANTLYYYRVSASTETVEWGKWSEIYTFKVLVSSSTTSEETAPEISIGQDTTEIVSNGTYNFNSIDVGSSSSVVFTIKNSGSEDLILSGSPLVEIIGTDALMFSVNAQPSSKVTAGNSTIFTIEFSPTSEGAKTVSVSISNNDSDENPFIFTISGIGGSAPVGPEISVRQSSDNISDGGTYAFSDTSLGSSTSTVFTIENIGDENLTFTGSPLTDISGTNASEFSVSSQLSTPVAPSGNTTFTIVFEPTSTGSKTASISIANNDSDENPFTLTITGSSGGQSAGVWDSSNWDECIWDN